MITSVALMSPVIADDPGTIPQFTPIPTALVNYTPRVVQWTFTKSFGFTYYMPPLDCRFGPLPPYKLIYLDSATMDKMFLPKNPPVGEKHIWGSTDIVVGGVSTVYITKWLPKQVSIDILTHEQAHLRGCEHAAQFGN